MALKKRARLTPLPLGKDLLRQIYVHMVRSRVLEERLIKIYKVGEAYFWIGGPGEEAFGVPLGMLVRKGQGPTFDYLHLSYRATSTLVAMGMSMLDAARLIMNRVPDPSTGGRNFASHYCFPKWNVVPVSSPIAVQYVQAIGTAHVQKRRGDALTVVTGGDAGTAEGDFASCLVWASRPANPLPLLITVQNNRWGISTSFESQHGEKNIADRGRAFGMRTRVINGNDPIETYVALKEEMSYIRKKRRPVLLEASVSRLFGHSSADGANQGPDFDPVAKFNAKLLKHGVIDETFARATRNEAERDSLAAQVKAREERVPAPESVWDHVFADGETADWRKF